MARAARALILHGATAERPDELDTLVQAESVAASLRRLGWRTEILPVGLDLKALARQLKSPPGLVFNLVEAIEGDGRLVHLVPSLLEHLNIPYSGAPASAHFVTTNKPLAKQLLRGTGLPTPDWATADGPDAARVLRRHRQVIVKSAWEDASIGIDAGSVVPARRAGAELVARQTRYGGEWFAEAYVEGREFNVGLLEGPDGPRSLPIAEILFVDYPPERPRIVDYEAKWLEDSFAYSHTPRRFGLPAEDLPLIERLQELAVKAFRLFGLRGYGRVDFRIDQAGRPWILEVNANPCLSEDAGFMAAAAEAGLTLDDVVGQILCATSRERQTAAA